jgi:putative tryptophan/tyrosine transport system substrate-binding protein
MKRRDFIAVLGGTAAWSLLARAQKPAMPVIGFLSSTSPTEGVTAFRQSLSEVGYVEGQNVVFEYRWAEGHYDRLPALAADLVRIQVAVIVAGGGNAPALAAKAATSRIPIVFLTGGDPVKAGLVASLNRPGGNVTGLSFILSALVPKRLELLHELVPKAAAIGALVNPDYPDVDLQQRELQEAAKSIRQQIYVVSAGAERDIDTAFATLVQRKTDALLVANDPFFESRRQQIVALAARHAIPAIYSGRAYVAVGGLVSYGSSLTEGNVRQASTPAGSSTARSRPICRSCSRRNSSW